MMRRLLPTFPTACFALALLASQAVAEGEGATPQRDWMVHMDKSSGEWRYLPERPVLVPGGTVQLMVFGDGRFSLVLDDVPDKAADISSANGTIRTAEFAAPEKIGEYPFHDKYHPEARGVLVVQEAQPEPTIGVVPGGYESRFAPDRLVVAPGATVRFTANGTFGHNLESTDGSFTAGDLAPGQASTFGAPETPGEYTFRCRFHEAQGMVGTLVVTGSPTGSAAPTSEAIKSTEDVPDVGLGAILLILGCVAATLAIAARRRA